MLWWSNEEVALSDKPRKELERTDILPNSQAVTLALACMGVGELEIYGYNNDNHEHKNFKKTEFTLGPGLYYIHVLLSGIHLKPTDFWFEVWRDTMSGDLKIKKIEKPRGIA